jgi:hypothetical protein
MTPNYPQLVADTVSELPVTRQTEVYHFVQFMKKEKKLKRKKWPVQRTGNEMPQSAIFRLSIASHS